MLRLTFFLFEDFSTRTPSIRSTRDANMNVICDKRWLAVAGFSLYCLAFGSIRFFLEGNAWGFLHHNLWLAWIPLLIAMVIKAKRAAGGWLVGLWVVWLAFLPNAPYIVTDLVHMRGKSTLPWFDLLVLFHFALAGLLVGALSLEWMEDAVARSHGRIRARILSGFAVIASGIGLVMGRDLRLNSEDVFTKPQVVLQTISDVLSRAGLTKSFVYALTFGAFYILFRTLTSSRQTTLSKYEAGP